MEVLVAELFKKLTELTKQNLIIWEHVALLIYKCYYKNFEVIANWTDEGDFRVSMNGWPVEINDYSVGIDELREAVLNQSQELSDFAKENRERMRLNNGNVAPACAPKELIEDFISK